VFDDLGTDQPSLFGKAVISTDTRSLTAEDLEFFGPPVRVLSVAGGSLSPRSRLVWFEATAEGDPVVHGPGHTKGFAPGQRPYRHDRRRRPGGRTRAVGDARLSRWVCGTNRL